MELPRGAMVAHRILVPVVHVRIVAGQQRCLDEVAREQISSIVRTLDNPASPSDTCFYPRGVMVAAPHSKCGPNMGCRFDSGRGYKQCGRALLEW